jgi:hypothetical protein
MTANGDAALDWLKLYTHNIDRVLKPSQDGELAHAIHETLHFSLDGQPQDYLIPLEQRRGPCGDGPSSSKASAAASTSAKGKHQEEDDEEIQPGFFATEDEERPYISYDWDAQNRLLTLPHPKTVQNPTLSDPCTSAGSDASDVRDAFDVTVKFFYLQKMDRYPAEWIEEAMDCLRTATGLETADAFILAFPTLKLDCSQATDGQVDDKTSNVAQVWRQISSSERISSLGISDISHRALASLLRHLDLPACNDSEAKQEENNEAKKAIMTESMIAKGAAKTDRSHEPVSIPSSPSKVFLKQLPEDSLALQKAYGPGPCRRPRLCTINLREQECDDNSLGGQSVSRTHAGRSSCWDRGLADFCKEEKIQLVAHSDQKDILPARTLPTLLSEFEGRIPHALPSSKSLRPLWCLKYTVLIRDRGVLADKGFILFCQATES